MAHTDKPPKQRSVKMTYKGLIITVVVYILFVVVWMYGFRKWISLADTPFEVVSGAGIPVGAPRPRSHYIIPGAIMAVGLIIWFVYGIAYDLLGGI